uniref:Uncharacterized protein n=1 Tax=Avena sativa TaxID=4498 RepID=A0ACD5XEA9_AVESA
MTTSTSSRGDLSLPPGTVFIPTDYDLTDTYLRCKIAGKELPGATARRFIHVADVYSAEPEKLVEGFDHAPGKEAVWYFFSSVRYVGGRKRNARGGAGRKSRTIDGEGGKRWWHSERGETPVKGGSQYGGYEQYFSYKVKNASTGKDERAGWIMTEYGISPEHGGGDLVLCKIHRSPRPLVASAEAAAPVLDPMVISKKRKAPASDHAEDPKASSRPRRTVDQDEQRLQAAASTVEEEDAAEQNRDITGDGFMFEEDPITELRMKFPLLFPVSDQASNFLQDVEHDFRSIYQQNSTVMPLGALPWAPATQPQDAAAAQWRS